MESKVATLYCPFCKNFMRLDHFPEHMEKGDCHGDQRVGVLVKLVRRWVEWGPLKGDEVSRAVFIEAAMPEIIEAALNAPGVTIALARGDFPDTKDGKERSHEQ